jgi:hypothetical protein
MTTDYWTYRPSKRPKVSQVKEWDLLFEDSILDHWRGPQYDCTVRVVNGYPFPDFYKVEVDHHNTDSLTTRKFFYGESAWSDVNRYVYDLGFTRWQGL